MSWKKADSLSLCMAAVGLASLLAGCSGVSDSSNGIGDLSSADLSQEELSSQQDLILTSSSLGLSSADTTTLSSEKSSSSGELLSSSSLYRPHSYFGGRDGYIYRQPDTSMVIIPAGCFTMGSSDTSLHGRGKQFGEGFPLERRVCVSSFLMDPLEVQEWDWMQWTDTLWGFDNLCGPDCPKESIGFLMAEKYCVEHEKRLPTEAEWEWAARGGATTYYSWGPDTNGLAAHVWWVYTADEDRYDRSGTKHVGWWKHPVGTKLPNGYGLYDMAGNVYEMVKDYYGPIDETDTINPRGAKTPEPHYYDGSPVRLAKGGSYEDFSPVRSNPSWSIQVSEEHSSTWRTLGFRCVKDLP